MNYLYPYFKGIHLHVRERISEEDAQRQELTAKEILKRLSQRPGVILADEVGMGKTFVALAVAVSVALANRGRRPVVVMVPSSLREKWPRDFELFRQKILSPEVAKRVRWACAERAIDFLKLLDDPPSRRKQIIFVTHGAMSRNLDDKWVKLAIVAQAIRGRHGAPQMRIELSRVLADLLYMPWVERHGQDIWLELLQKSPMDWLSILQKWHIDPEGDKNPDTNDDPVPKAVHSVLYRMNTDAVYQALQEEMPKRRTDTYRQRVQRARQAINAEMRDLWKDCVHQLKLSLPLLVLDEAHHLKNPNTRLASLFRNAEAEDDVEQVTRGPLAGAFERMLFLTATPFQLGHAELCSVLERFDGISWKSRLAPNSGGQEAFQKEIKGLRWALDAAQSAALKLDSEWGLLQKDDLQANGKMFEREDEWWASLRQGNGATPTGERVLQSYENTRRRMREAEQALKPWVIRHLKPRALPRPHEGVARRCPFPGGGILVDGTDTTDAGLLIPGEALLPFLLAARATTQAPESRPVFAEGLASSYEAFLQTRLARSLAEHQLLDGDDDGTTLPDATDAMRWYLDQLERLIPHGDAVASISHPKIAATVNRTLDLWRTGEKVVVFCHYIATGKVLRQRISEAVNHVIQSEGSRKMSCPPSEVNERLERIGKRFFDEDSPIRRACDAAARELLEPFPTLAEYNDDLLDIVRRNVRTPSFLVRFFPLQKHGEDAMKEALKTHDSSGMCLQDLLGDFFRFLVDHCGDEDRRRYIEAVKGIQTGSHFGTDTSRAFAEDELQGEQPERLVPNVRLVNGSTKSDTRQRLMLTFNTPFYPEILVTSNVLAEGVDLHLNCRHVIHHDLCWNPSTLEQRTGRIDRIGAKAERCGKSIYLYLPYIAETQDEKMYRVVMDRQRWFSVVMGESYKVDAKSVEKLANRIPLPEEAASELAFRLEVFK